MTKRVIIIGAGGHARVIADIITANGDIVEGFLDDRNAADFHGIEIKGRISDAPQMTGYHFVIAIGDNYIRRKISETYPLNWYTAIHPTAVISPSVSVGAGTVVMANTVINANAKIGRHVIINTSAVIEHDNLINDYCHISPCGTLGGTVKIGSCVHVGIGAVVINNISICADCVIGGGAVVIKDINESGTYIGVPAEKLINGMEITL